jgi:hypothetical protein
MIIPLRIRRLAILLLPLSILGAGFGMYRHQSYSPPIVLSQDFDPLEEYTFCFGETTGHALYVQKDNVGIAIDFDEGNSNRLALGALLGCESGYGYGQCLILVGHMSRMPHPCEENKRIGMQTSDYTFRLQHWYLSKHPCDRHSKEDIKHQWERSNFTKQPEYGFFPNSPSFNPHLYEKPLPF